MRQVDLGLALMLAGHLLLATGCGGYRFVDPMPSRDIHLEEVRNSSAEPGLAQILEDSMRAAGFGRGDDGRKLYLAITDFTDQVDSISSDGTPIRHRVSITVFWRLGPGEAASALFGEERASLSYPYSPDTATLDWNRKAAVWQLCGKVADQVKVAMREIP